MTGQGSSLFVISSTLLCVLQHHTTVQYTPYHGGALEGSLTFRLLYCVYVKQIGGQGASYLIDYPDYKNVVDNQILQDKNGSQLTQIKGMQSFFLWFDVLFFPDMQYQSGVVVTPHLGRVHPGCLILNSK